MQTRYTGLTIVVSAFVAGAASQAFGATYQIGPGKLAGFAQLPALKPGDVVEVAGGASYGAVTLKTDGSADQKITFRGIRVGGKRPVLNGGTNTLQIDSSHVVIEGFDITGGSSRCVFHHANDVTIRDTVIHDCPAHGLLGADNGSGSLLMEYDEVYHCGLGDQKHQIYMATDEDMYPGSVFRLQFSYLHDGNGGHGVKSRAERNEIYYNWIEGSYYHELELIGPDPSGGVDPDKAREDSDVVGNVIRKAGAHSGAHTMRLGGDGTGDTNGRYRFVNNTIVLAANSGSVFRIFDRVDTLEAHNNVIYRVGGGSTEVVRTAEAATPLPMVAGTNNWMPTGTAVPAGFTGSINGADPVLAAIAAKDLRPMATSPLVDKGALTIAGIAARPFPRPLPAPLFEPPAGVLLAVGTAAARVHGATIDIGAYEHGGAMPTPPVTDPPTTMPPTATPPTTTPPSTTPPTTTPPTTTPPGNSMPPVTTPPSGAIPPAMGTPGTTPPTGTGGQGGSSGGPIPGTVGDPSDTETSRAAKGCSFGGRGAGGAWMALLALGLVRRRRRRA
jgi:hypothetical protein